MSFEDFTMRAADGKDFKLSSLKDKKVILLQFWSSSCLPCRAKHPALLELYKKYADQGFEVVNISLDQNSDAWHKAMKQDNISAWINVSDLQGWQSQLVKNYSLYYIPFGFLINGERKILRVYHAAMLPENDIIAFLQPPAN